MVHLIVGCQGCTTLSSHSNPENATMATVVWLDPPLSGLFRNPAPVPVDGSKQTLSLEPCQPGVGMACEELPEFIRTNYEVHEWNHACVILVHDFPKELKDIVDVLTEFRLFKSHIEAPGGGKSPLTAGLERAFRER